MENANNITGGQGTIDCGEGKGSMLAQIYTANGSVPVSGARVTVSDTEGNTLYELYTDNSGRTDKVELCVPSAANSQREGNRGNTYGIFNVRVEKQGYYTEEFLNVAVFDGIESIQPVLLEPLGENALEGDRNSEYRNGDNGNGGSLEENSARIGDALVIREQPVPAADTQQTEQEGV